jgi:hypothetical protein
LKSPRRLLTVILVGLATTALWILLGQPGYSKIGGSPNDNLLYWSAGRALRNGLNPYSESVVHDIARTAADAVPTVPAYYPPWSLPLFAAFAGLNYDTFRRFWLIASAAIAVLSVILIESSTLRARKDRPLHLLILGSFFPLYLALYLGQFSVLPLLFFALYQSRRQRQDFIAGLLLAACLFKPNLFILIFVTEIWSMLAGRKLASLAGFATGVSALLAMPLCFEPGIYFNWFAAPSAAGSTWQNPNLGVWLTLLGSGAAWLRFAPLAVSLPALALICKRRRGHAMGSDQFTALLGLNLIVSPYVWTYDFLMLTPLLVDLVGEAILGIDVLLILVNVLLWFRGGSYHYDAWYPIAVLAIYCCGAAFSRRMAISSS